MKKLSECGKYELTKEDFAKISSDFIGYYTDEEETAKTIKNTYENRNCLIDTHTAVALCAALKYKDDHKAERKILTVSTASAYKFAADVYASLTGERPTDELEALTMLEALTGEPIPTPLRELGSKEDIHTSVIKKANMKDAVSEFAKG